MKNLKISLLFLLSLCVACKDDFLDRKPQTAITENTFFANVADLETYTNGFYGSIGPRWDDIYSDNLSVYTGGSDTENLVRGSLTPASVGGWSSWGTIRRINFFLTRAGKASGDPSLIKHYTGIGRFFRAMVYYDMVKRYGDVPWYSTVLASNDEELLYKAKDPRTVVVDSIMNDLEYASANILPSRTNNTMVTKWAALTLLARISLHEGTFRLYHDELNLKNTSTRFLTRAASAAQEVMEKGGFSLTNTGNGAVDFRNLFSSNNLSANKEVIMLNKNSKDDGITNNTHVVLDWQWALSQDLANDFLNSDGTTFTSKSNYDKLGFVESFANRDPRLSETIMPPGFTTVPGTNPYLPKPSFGGYLQVKFYPRDPALRGGFGLNYTDLPIFRLAEPLLVYAEAKAELGQLTQGDLDKTVNLLRKRVGMPDLNLNNANANPDSYLANKYPNVTGSNKGVILEIRRERRVELACEGFRFDDIYRWKVGRLLAKASTGMYISKLGGIDVTGDGKEDIAILEAPGKEDPLTTLPADIKSKIVKYYLSDGSFYLSNGTYGNIVFTKDKVQPRDFNENKYYYFPIPQQQIILNKNLTQPAGW